MSRSSVFEKMFDSKMVEAKSGTVVIEDMEADTLQRLLEFTYTGEVTDMRMHMQEVMELFWTNVWTKQSWLPQIQRIQRETLKQ